MIQSKKARVVTGFHQSSLEIRKLELDYFLMVFDKLSTIASLLAGFASSALMVDIPRGRNPFIVTLFLISTSSALGSLLLVVVVATMCTMWGPGRALIGSDAKCMEEAVEILQERKDGMERFFFLWAGLLFHFVNPCCMDPLQSNGGLVRNHHNGIYDCMDGVEIFYNIKRIESRWPRYRKSLVQSRGQCW